MSKPYNPEHVPKIAESLIKEIEKYYPGLTKYKFDSRGNIDKRGKSAQKRAEICIYIELIKAGAFNNET